MSENRKPLWKWQSPLFYPFCLGLFNSFVCLGFVMLISAWLSVRWLEGLEYCQCGPYTSFLFWHLWVPTPLTWTFLLRVFACYFLFSGLEWLVLAGIGIKKMPPLQGLLFFPVLALRVFLRNLPGLLFLLTLFAMDAAKWAYALSAVLSLGFIWLGQSGKWYDFSLNYWYASGWKGLEKTHLDLLFWASTLVVASFLLLLPLAHFGPFYFILLLYRPEIVIFLLVLGFIWFKLFLNRRLHRRKAKSAESSSND